MSHSKLNTTGKQLFILREDGLMDEYEVRIAIDFDFPEVHEKIKEMSIWSGEHPDESAPFEEHLDFVLRKIAYTACHLKAGGYNDYGVIKEIEDYDGFYPLDGSCGILIVGSAVPELDMDCFQVDSQQAYVGDFEIPKPKSTW